MKVSTLIGAAYSRLGASPATVSPSALAQSAVISFKASLQSGSALMIAKNKHALRLSATVQTAASALARLIISAENTVVWSAK